jgi:hypothetical protein
MSHFSTSKVSTSLDEPLYKTKFLGTFILPPILRPKYGVSLMSEQLIKVGGLTTDKLPEEVTQWFRTTKRRFLGTVVDTNVDVDTTFEVNVNKSGVIYPFNILREWSYLGYDAQTGFQGLKEDYVGSFNLDILAKNGKILRKIYFPIFFPIKPLNDLELNSTEEGNYQIQMTWAGENYRDQIIQGNPG